jgi:folate-binding protein YgfZ
MPDTATRSVLRISGEDCVHFLQGLVTNDMSKLGDERIIYAALLTPQGKYLADFFLIPDGDAILLDVDAGLAADLTRRLTMYRMRAKVAVAVTELKVHCGIGAAPVGALHDPRHPSLGWRSYGDQSQELADADALRVAACVPLSGVELLPDQTFILEAGFDRLNGVDFRKGCYVGQEVTARMRHKTELRKGLVTVQVDGKAPVGTEIFIGGKSAGTLFTQANGHAIAYLRFDRATGTMTAGDAKVTWEKPAEN